MALKRMDWPRTRLRTRLVGTSIERPFRAPEQPVNVDVSCKTCSDAGNTNVGNAASRSRERGANRSHHSWVLLGRFACFTSLGPYRRPGSQSGRQRPRDVEWMECSQSRGVESRAYHPVEQGGT